MVKIFLFHETPPYWPQNVPPKAPQKLSQNDPEKTKWPKPACARKKAVRTHVRTRKVRAQTFPTAPQTKSLPKKWHLSGRFGDMIHNPLGTRPGGLRAARLNNIKNANNFEKQKNA